MFLFDFATAAVESKFETGTAMFGNAQLSSWSAATRQAGITMGRHPLVWWIGARLVATREEACDEHVVAETAEPLAYAEGIVTVCRRYVEAPLMSVAGVGGADVKARIDAILSNRIGLRVTLPKRLVLATAAVVT
ncbi:MAG: hypothetical protein ACRD3G_29990, partial [Vicinamibacterales bacterium]